MQSKATTVAEYLAELPEDRRKAISALRKVIKANLGKGFKEGMQYGMIGYFVPHSIYPAGYHCTPEQPLPFASLASQKNHMAFYSFFLYQDPEALKQFQDEWKASEQKLDMGKSCVRFKKVDDLDLDLILESISGVTVDEFVEVYRRERESRKKR